MDAAFVDQLVRRGLISPDALERMSEGEPQRQSRMDILRQGLDAAKDYLTPGYLRDTPSSPQADRALADPNGTPGKIGPPSGPPTTAQMIGGLAGDVGMNALPAGKLLAGGKMLAASGGLPWWIEKPALAKKADDLIARGYGTRTAANELEISRGNMRRYLESSNQKTAGQETLVDFWQSNPGSEDQLRQMKLQGIAHSAIAQRFGVSKDAIDAKVFRMLAAGDLPDSVRRPPPFLKDPQKRADLIRLALENESQGNIASYFYGGPGGAHPRRADISQFIKQLQEEGTPEEREALKNYVPRGGKGLTPAGKTPTLPQLKSQSREAPPPDQDYVKALRSLGLSL